MNRTNRPSLSYPPQANETESSHMTLTVVPIRESTTLVNDIPGQLRQLADRIDAGEVEAKTVICVIPIDDDWPRIFGWGEDLGDFWRIGLLQTAVTWFATRITGR